MSRAPTWWILLTQQLRRRLRSIAIWGVALGGLGALYVALYPSMSGLLEQYLEQASEEMQQFMGGLQGPMTIERWLELELIGSIIPIALPFMAMAIGARAVAGSEERKTLDLLLSNPLPRRHVIIGSLGTMAAALAGVLAITWILTYIAVPAAGLDLSPGRLAMGLAVLWPFCLFFGALALLFSALIRRSFLAITIPGVVLVAMYVIGELSQVSKTIEPLRTLSLFHHLGNPLAGDFPWIAVLATLAAIVALGAAAVATFSRRDIYT
jgi:ABC-2 type transport system permease protein